MAKHCPITNEKVLYLECLECDNKVCEKTNNFNAKEVKNKIVKWIKEWFEQNGPNCNAVIGLSGGKDSMVLLYALNEIKKYYPLSFEIKAITLDPCFYNKEGIFYIERPRVDFNMDCLIGRDE